MRPKDCKAKTVKTFPGGDHVMRKLAQEGPREMPAIVITDLRCPGIVGYAVVEKLLENFFQSGSVAIMPVYGVEEGGAGERDG